VTDACAYARQRRFEKAIEQLYAALRPGMDKLNDKRVQDAFARLANELHILCCLYYYEDAITDRQTPAFAAVVLRDAIQRQFDFGDDDDGDEDVVQAELQMRVTALKHTFSNFAKAKLNQRSFDDFHNTHVTKTIPDVMQATKLLVRHVQLALYGPPRLRAPLEALAAGKRWPPKQSASEPASPQRKAASPQRASAAAQVAAGSPARQQLGQKKPRYDTDVFERAVAALGISDAVSLRESAKGLRELDPLELVVKAPKRASLAVPPPPPRHNEQPPPGSPARQRAATPQGTPSARHGSGNTPQVKRAAPSSASKKPVKALTPAAPSPAKPQKKRGSDEQQRMRLPWSLDEIQALIDGVKAHGAGNWAVILNENKEIFNSVKPRTSVDLKDKYRNLGKRAA